MLVAPGIMSVFMGNIQDIFLNGSIGATACNTPEPASGACPLEHYLQRRFYNTIAKTRGGPGGFMKESKGRNVDFRTKRLVVPDCFPFKKDD